MKASINAVAAVLLAVSGTGYAGEFSLGAVKAGDVAKTEVALPMPSAELAVGKAAQGTINDFERAYLVNSDERTAGLASQLLLDDGIMDLTPALYAGYYGAAVARIAAKPDPASPSRAAYETSVSALKTYARVYDQAGKEAKSMVEMRARSAAAKDRIYSALISAGTYAELRRELAAIYADVVDIGAVQGRAGLAMDGMETCAFSGVNADKCEFKCPGGTTVTRPKLNSSLVQNGGCAKFVMAPSQGKLFNLPGSSHDSQMTKVENPSYVCLSEGDEGHAIALNGSSVRLWQFAGGDLRMAMELGNVKVVSQAPDGKLNVAGDLTLFGNTSRVSVTITPGQNGGKPSMTSMRDGQATPLVNIPCWVKH